MNLFKVTLLARKKWMNSSIEMSSATIADTADGAIEQVTDDLDLTGVIVDKYKAEKIDHPLLINIKE